MIAVDLCRQRHVLPGGVVDVAQVAGEDFVIKYKLSFPPKDDGKDNFKLRCYKIPLSICLIANIVPIPASNIVSAPSDIGVYTGRCVVHIQVPVSQFDSVICGQKLHSRVIDSICGIVAICMEVAIVIGVIYIPT